MKTRIIQGNKEPHKSNLWLNKDGLQRFGTNGWENVNKIPIIYLDERLNIVDKKGNVILYKYGNNVDSICFKSGTLEDLEGWLGFSLYPGMTVLMQRTFNVDGSIVTAQIPLTMSYLFDEKLKVFQFSGTIYTMQSDGAGNVYSDDFTYNITLDRGHIIADTDPILTQV